jgi:hypothetical protein
MSGSPPRRDNGLTATSYARLDDVETHLVDELLDRLAQAGVAAYSAPTLGRRGPYGETVPPMGPSDSVYVDANHHDRARSVTNLYLREIREDIAWSDIVAGFDLDTADSVPRWPVSEDLDEDDTEDADGADGHDGAAGDDGTEATGPGRRQDAAAGSPPGPTVGFDVLREGVPSPVVRRDDSDRPEAAEAAEAADDHFRPPPPPPLPEIDRIGRFAWAGALGGPAVLLLAALAGIQLEGWVGFLALVAFMAGFVTLVARMKDPPADSDPDDGAVV